MTTMATALNWNLLSPLVQTAARPIGQTAMRYEKRDAIDEVRIYFASGWYADVAWEMIAGLDPWNPKSIERLFVELRKQYEEHGMPIALRDEVQRRADECMAKYDDAVIERLVEKVQQYGGKPDSFKIREDGTFVAQGPIRYERPPEPAHTCPGCGSPCDPPINVWSTNLYGCAKCCPSVGSYSSRIVIKYPDHIWNTAARAWIAEIMDDATPLLIDGLTEAECLAEYSLAQKDVKRSRELTLRQLEVARMMWSARLRAKVTESTEKERARVVLDTSMWDD